jgi:hypothetical protein
MKDRLIKLFRSEALRTRVWVSDKYRYTMQMVKLWPMSGLNVGERVAASANFLIDSESNLKEAIVRNVTAVHDYEPNTWGPPEAQRIIVGDGGWHTPKHEEAIG